MCLLHISYAALVTIDVVQYLWMNLFFFFFPIVNFSVVFLGDYRINHTNI